MKENNEMGRLKNGMLRLERQKRKLKGGKIEISKVSNGKWKRKKDHTWNIKR
jgi:hypothetical protein